MTTLTVREMGAGGQWCSQYVVWYFTVDKKVPKALVVLSLVFGWRALAVLRSLASSDF